MERSTDRQLPPQGLPLPFAGQLAGLFHPIGKLIFVELALIECRGRARRRAGSFRLRAFHGCGRVGFCRQGERQHATDTVVGALGLAMALMEYREAAASPSPLKAGGVVERLLGKLNAVLAAARLDGSIRGGPRRLSRTTASSPQLRDLEMCRDLQTIRSSSSTSAHDLHHAVPFPEEGRRQISAQTTCTLHLKRGFHRARRTFGYARRD
jgi:hypothetical protein